MQDNPASQPAPTNLEIATLAAQFLPPLDVEKECIEALAPATRAALGLKLKEPFPGAASIEEALPQEAFLTPEEILCHAAVRRARALLNAVAGNVRPEVVAQQAAAEKSWKSAEAGDPYSTRLKTAWSSLKKLKLGNDGVERVSLETMLECVLPNTKPKRSTKGVTAHEKRLFLWEKFCTHRRKLAKRANLEEGIMPSADSPAKSLDAFSERELIHYGTNLLLDYNEHKLAWDKSWERKRENDISDIRSNAGKKSAASRLAATDLSTDDKKNLMSADTKAKAKTPSLKRASTRR